MTNLTTTKWNLDLAHSTVGFTVKHMMVSKVRGNFAKVTAHIDANETDLSTAKIDFTIDVASINTNNDDRDNHLRSADFFDVENFPTMNFVATSITKTSEGNYDLTGDFTIKGVTNSVTFKVEYEGKGTNPWGQEVIGFTAAGAINRKEFGLTWNQALETGGVLVSDEVKLNLEIQLNPAQ